MQLGENPPSASNAGPRWPVVAACILGLLLLVAAARSVFQDPASDLGAEARRNAARVRITHLAAVLAAARNAETCSRGYFITGDVGFLLPFEQALEVQTAMMSQLELLYAGDVERGPLLRDLRDALASQRAHMSRTVALRRTSAADAQQLIESPRGQELTDSVHAAIQAIVIDERSKLARERAQ